MKPSSSSMASSISSSPNDLTSTPPPPPGRRRSGSSISSSTTSSSSSSSNSSASSSFPSPHRFILQSTPFHPSSSSIPFSWERTPGIPKSNNNNNKSLKTYTRRPLPLPPPLRSHSSFPRTKDDNLSAVDPFALALVECAKDPPPADDAELWMRPQTAPAIPGARRWSIVTRIGFLDLYRGSCKSSCSVSDSTTIQIPRPPHRVVASYRRFG